MAQQPQPQYEFHYQKVELLKTKELGIGSYGAVCKAMCDDLPCAAKILHPALFQFTAPRTTSVMQKFEQECHLLSAIKHPHIVQYLGTYHDPESRLPVLLMELMDESLTRFLERSHEPLPYHTEVNLCHDIVLALSYLHSNGIVHRDLSSNNVLLVAGSRAKVSDFGMVKLYNVNHSKAHLTPLTLCPGTMAYMSPEALGEPPVYTDKLDSFSLGVLCVQIMTQQFPDPGNRFKIIEINDPRAPSGRVQVEIPEIERRQSHIDLIDPAHPLLPVALDCLKDRDRERPSCHELCGRMFTLKASPKYTESVQQSQVNTKPTQSAHRESREREIQQSQQIQDLQQQLHTRDDQLHTLRDQLQEKEQENQQQRQQILGQQSLLTETNDQLQILQQEVTTKDEQLAGKDEQLAGKDEQLAGKDEQLAGKDEQLAGKDEQLADQLQQKEVTNASHLQEIQQLTQQLHTKDGKLHTLSDQLQCKEKEIQQQQQQILGLQNLVTATSDEVEILQQNLTTKDEQLTDKDQQLAGKDHQLQQKEATIDTHQQEIQQLRQQLHTKEDHLHTLRDQLQTFQQRKDEQLQQKEAAIAGHQEEIQQLRQQLQTNEQVTAEFQRNLLEREKMIQDQQKQILKLQQQRRKSREQRPSQEKMEGSGAAAASGSGRAPRGMYGQVATVDESKVYFRCGVRKEEKAVYSYDLSSKKWSELPECPNYGFSLAMVNGFLTAIGGKKPSDDKTSKDEITNSLLSLIDNKWMERFHPMPTKRWLTAAVCSGKSLVVAGGLIADKRLSTVEVMNTETRVWFTASSLPHLLSEASATLCDNRLYVLGGFDQSQQSKSVFTCSLDSLLQSCQPLSLGPRRRPSEHRVWRQLADTPVTLSTCTSLLGKLLTVGGIDSDDKETTAIHMYNATTKSWEVISHKMETPRSQCLVAVPPCDKLMVVGGDASNCSVEIVDV